MSVAVLRGCFALRSPFTSSRWSVSPGKLSVICAFDITESLQMQLLAEP
jgi:hypothetical protein